jgi:hypothetical protein
MPTRRKAPPKTAETAGVTSERFTRLYRMVRLLAASPQPRESLAKRLHLDIRGFYRDLEVLRTAGIVVRVAGGRYGLVGKAEEALTRLPFPDPHLTLGDVRALGKGKSPAHAKLREQIGRLVP